MSEQNAPARPRQVTVAGVMGVLGSVLLVVSLFDTMGRLRSVEMREAVRDVLAEPPGNGLGVSLGTALDVLHGVVLFNGALAAVAAVMAIYVFQRHQAARLGFSIAAGLLLFTAPLSGATLAIVLAFAATLLWGRPARDWFAGREPMPVAAGGAAPETPPRAEPWGAGSGQAQAADGEEPPAYDRPAYPAPAGESQPPPSSYPFGQRPDADWAPPGYQRRPVPGPGAPSGERPLAVTVAATITWLFAGGTALVYLLVVAMMMFAQDSLLEVVRNDSRLQELSISTGNLLATLWVMSAVAIFWGVSAVILAVLAFRRQSWARYALVFSAAMAALASLGGFPVGVVHTLAAGTTVFLLLRRDTSAWYAGRGAGGPAGPPGPPGQQGGYPPPGQQPPAPYPPPDRQGKPGKPPVW